MASLDELFVATIQSGLPNWNSEPDYCQRVGVMCDSGGSTVLELHFADLNLAGSFPSLSNLTNLARLYDPSILRVFTCFSQLLGTLVET